MTGLMVHLGKLGLHELTNVCSYAQFFGWQYYFFNWLFKYLSKFIISKHRFKRTMVIFSMSLIKAYAQYGPPLAYCGLRSSHTISTLSGVGGLDGC